MLYRGCEGGVRKYEKNNSADTKLSKEGGERDASGTEQMVPWSPAAHGEDRGETGCPPAAHGGSQSGRYP